MENQPIVEFNAASILQRENLILADLNFSVYPKEFVYLVGRTGSGKSSLLKTLYGEVPLALGSGRIDEYDLRNLKKKQIPYLRRKIGIVFQDFQLLADRNVNENLYFVMRATGWKSRQKMEIRAREVLDKVNMSTKALQMPHQLSGGEQQRVAIARALINNPAVILADEPTGNLDPITTQEILQLLREISETGTAILMATHDYAYMSRFASRILKCEEGQLTELNGDKKSVQFQA
ncbi:MAG: ATP-binding cassette domain-containing protein [Bacteroidota bacterium]